MHKTVVTTGCDANFYPFMADALSSLRGLGLDTRADIGILDFGLAEDQLAALKSQGCTVVKPVWTLELPKDLEDNRALALIARTALRDYFPGYNSYLWFDADAWAQTSEFFDLMVEGTRARGAAIIRENGAGYRRDLTYMRWWYGHMVATYGLIDGVELAYGPAINIGILGLSDTAPHWEAWIRHYQKMIHMRHKANLDQHAFNAAVEMEGLAVAELPARCNWICTLSTPRWDSRRNFVCEPNGIPLSVIHLAGPDKRREYELRVSHGTALITPLTYDAVHALRNGKGGRPQSTRISRQRFLPPYENLRRFLQVG